MSNETANAIEIIKDKQQQKNKVIKNLTEAHSWLGIIISAVLFLIFWAGSVTLFYDEVKQWAELPHHPVDVHAPDMPLQKIVEQKLSQYNFDAKEHMTVRMPTEHRPYYMMSIDLVPEQGKEDQHGAVVNLLINPKSGATVSDEDKFRMADFIYKLHYDLNLPAGEYIVGIITLFFFFALISGIFIHAKKLVKNFFQYRPHKRKRDKLLDMHNVVGVMTLPFTLLFALTGLVFNLVIIYQIAFALFLYQGDQTALLKDAGYVSFTEKTHDIKQDMTPAFNLISLARNDATQDLHRVVFYNYGDTNAAIQLTALDKNNFAQRIEAFYRVNDGSVISETDIDNHNALRKGLDVLITLHFASFAGIDVRILYFILGIAVCAMILTGNMLWLDKRTLQKNVSTRAISIVRSLTVGACGGFIVATAAVFLAERLLPITLAERVSWIAYIYSAVLMLVMITSYWVSNNKHYIARLLQVTVVLLVLTIIADWSIFGTGILSLWQQGFRATLGVEIAMLLISAIALWVARLLLATSQSKAQVQSTAVMIENPAAV